MSIQGQFKAILRLDRRRRWRETHWPDGHHRFTERQMVEFTPDAFSKGHIGLRGVWEVKAITPTPPAGSTGFMFHPQMIHFENFPFGHHVSGYWLQPVKK
jgi:hypothetical protein